MIATTTTHPAVKFVKQFAIFLVPFAVLAIFMVGQFLAMRQQTHSWYFQDETEHVTNGWLIHEFGRTLYLNISTNHQPIPILFGGWVSQLIPYQTLFEFISRLRQCMFFWHFGLAVLLTLRFRWRAVIATLLTQSLAYQFFGWYVLAESLVIPAVLFCVLLLLERLYETPANKKMPNKVFDAAALGLSCAWLFFNALWLWPFAALSGLLYVAQAVQRKREETGKISLPNEVWVTLTAALVVVFALFTQFPPLDWYRESVRNLIVYFIPFEASKGGWLKYMQVLLYPALGFSALQSRLAAVFAAFALTLPVSGWLATKKKQWWLGLVVFIFVTSLNPRVSQMPATFYEGFHLWPYIAGISATLASFAWVTWLHATTRSRRFLVVFSWIAIVAAMTYYNIDWWTERKDRFNEYNIQYGVYDSHARAIGALAHPGDTILAGPDGHGYIHMMAGLPTAGKQLFHLDWANRVPDLRTYFENMLRTEPPTFIYYKTDDGAVSRVLMPLLATEYTELVWIDRTRSHLYINKKAAALRSEAEWKKLEDLLYRRGN